MSKRKYRLKRTTDNRIVQVWRPDGVKKDGSVRPGEFVNVLHGAGGYYGNYKTAIEYIIDDEIIPLEGELREQLENFPKALEEAVQRIMEYLEVED